jgi:hypothetical protein
MMFELELLMHHHSKIFKLNNPFAHEDIYDIVKELPSNKFSGPDGFNGEFFKKCCIIKTGVYDLYDQFYNGTLNVQCINSSCITLIPKKASPSNVNDFRPISLIVFSKS